MRNSNITNEKVIDYLDSLYRPLTPELGELRLKAEEDFVPIILRDTERFLDTMLRIVKPKRILEIGAAIGYSASCFAEICGRDTKIITLEADEKMHEKAVKNIERLGFSDQIDVIFGDARETAEGLSGMFDFVFIDASKSHYLEFWQAVKKNVGMGAVIVCDNVLMRAKTASSEYDPKHKFRTNIRKMREFLDYICNTDEAVTSVFAAGDGISVSYIL
ncbi:MAG: O-methyltransferase [Firmicutes bacterium]|nr:O-methyltransferase [Bacillota bacterium]